MLLDKKYFDGIRRNRLRNNRTNCIRRSTTSVLRDRRPKTLDYELLPLFSNAVFETLGVKIRPKAPRQLSFRNSHRPRFYDYDNFNTNIIMLLRRQARLIENV